VASLVCLQVIGLSELLDVGERALVMVAQPPCDRHRLVIVGVADVGREAKELFKLQDVGKSAPVLVAQAPCRRHGLVVVGVALVCLEAEQRFELLDDGEARAPRCW
jgi:hypothetical protein